MTDHENFWHFVYISSVTHVLVLFTILCCFFAFVISKVETNAFNSEMESIMSNAVREVKKNSNAALNRHISDVMKKPDISQYVDEQIKRLKTTPDITKTKTNAGVRRLGFAIIGMLTIVLVVSILLMNNFGQEVRTLKLLIETIFAFTMIGTIEMMFFQLVAKTYVPVKPSYMKRHFMHKLTNFFD